MINNCPDIRRHAIKMRFSRVEQVCRRGIRESDAVGVWQSLLCGASEALGA